jgi:uncharacterized repeat protein (TIGR01451 family)
LTASRAFAGATADIDMVSKTNDTGGSAAAGSTVTYNIDIHNNGPNGGSKLLIQDCLDTHLNFSGTNATQPDNCDTTTAPVSPLTCPAPRVLVSCHLQGVGNGSDQTLVITTTVKNDTPTDTTITNCASYFPDPTAQSPSDDPDSSNNSVCDGDGFTVVEQADMAVVKEQHDPLPASNPLPGATNVTYRITATNNGPSTAANVKVGDSITTGSATFVSATPVAPNTNGLDCSAFLAFGDFCTVASLASGQSVAFDLVVTLPNDGTTTITDTATTSSDTADSDDTNNSSHVTTTICQSVDLAITKACDTFCPPADTRASAIRRSAVSVCEPTAIVDPIPGGSDFQYDITVTNNDGSVTAHNVILADALPAGVSFVSVFPNPCVSGTIPANTCNLGDIGPGNSVSFSIHVTAVESGPVQNTGSVSADECDRNTQDNSASCSVTVETNNMPAALEADREASSTDTDCITTDPISTSSDHNRVFEPGEEVRIDPTWHNTLDNADADTTGTADTPSSPAGGTLTIEDCTADYGAIPANSDADCNSATGDCYQMKVTEDVAGVRPHLADHHRHWDTTFHETLSSGETKTWTLHIGDTFPDVPRTNGFYRFIETILHNRITIGCQNGDFFCPADPVIRAQIAAFVARSIAGNDTLVPTSSGDYNCSTGPSQFTDVPITNGFCKHINYLKDLKVVNGCTPTTFCPDIPGTRGQVAVVVARGFEVKLGNTADPDGSIPLFGNDTVGARAYNCDSVDHTNSVTAGNIPAGTPPFPDVPTSGDVCKSVGALYAAHVVDGSDPTHFNPNDNIRRDQAAKILTNEFVALPLYGPLTF